MSSEVPGKKPEVSERRLINSALSKKVEQCSGSFLAEPKGQETTHA